GKFLVKRLMRIIPIYFFLTFFYMLFQGSLVEYFTTKSDILIKALTFQPTFLKHTGSSYGMPPLIVGWSLNYEMLFYILFAASMFLKKYRYHFIFALFLFLVFGAPIIHHGFVSLDSSRYYEYPVQYMNILTNPTLLFFLSGVIFGLIYLSDFKIQSGVILFSLLGISIVFFLIILFINPVIFQPTQFMLLSCGLLVFIMLMIQKRYDFRVPKPLVYLGDMSYSIYLIHPLIISFVSDFFKKIGVPYLTKQPLFFFEATVIIILISILSYEYFEKRFIGYVTSKLIKKK
ncbi:MAG: acyltransferase, partial [Bacteroidota bacterium]|nr:acyltransferase [Bacteroidota bacterium]